MIASIHGGNYGSRNRGYVPFPPDADRWKRVTRVGYALPRGNEMTLKDLIGKKVVMAGPLVEKYPNVLIFEGEIVLWWDQEGDLTVEPVADYVKDRS